MENMNSYQIEQNPGLNHVSCEQAHLTLVQQECRVCNARGICLAEQMMADPDQVGLIRRNNRPFKLGEHIFRAGDIASELYVVKSGTVKSYMISEEGEEQVLAFYMPGDVFGLDAAEGSAHQSSAVALMTTSICRLPVALMSEQGQGRGYPKLIAEQMLRNQNLVLMLARKDADGRLASFLLDVSQRFARNGYSPSEFNLSMSRQDIGSYLGLAIETVSRTLTRFQEGGVIEVNRRNLEILDFAGLAKMAGVHH